MPKNFLKGRKCCKCGGIDSGRWYKLEESNLCKTCHGFIKKYGTTNIKEIKIIKLEIIIKTLEGEYGIEFANWARKNINKVPLKFIKKGCKTEKEYKDKCAIDAGFENWNERRKEWRHETGRQFPLEDSEEYSVWFGEFVENLMINYYPGAKKMPYGNPGFDFLWKDKYGKELKIQNKGRCLYYGFGTPICIFPIRYNNIADIFILSVWNNRKDLNPLLALEFKKCDLVKLKGLGMIEFWNRENFSFNYTPDKLEQFKDHQIDICRLIKSRILKDG